MGADDGRSGAARGSDAVPPGVTSRWEWVVGAVGALFVAATIAFMGYEALTREYTPPDIVVRVDSVSRTSAGWLVEFRAINRGGSTAAQVRIEGELRGGGDRETSETTIDYVPGRSERRAGIIFSRDPRRDSLELRARGFDLP